MSRVFSSNSSSSPSNAPRLPNLPAIQNRYSSVPSSSVQPPTIAEEKVPGVLPGVSLADSVAIPSPVLLQKNLAAVENMPMLSFTMLPHVTQCAKYRAVCRADGSSKDSFLSNPSRIMDASNPPVGLTSLNPHQYQISLPSIYNLPVGGPLLADEVQKKVH